MPHKSPKTTMTSLLQRENRRLQVVEMVKRGAKQTEIAEKLDVAASTVAKDIKLATEQIILTRLDETVAWGLQFERLNDLYTYLLEQLVSGTAAQPGADDTTAITGAGSVDRLLAIVDIQNKMSGNYAPSKLALTTPNGKGPYEPRTRITTSERAQRVAEILVASGSGSISEQFELRRARRDRQPPISGPPEL